MTGSVDVSQWPMLLRVAPSSPLAWFIAMLMLLVGIRGESALSLFVWSFVDAVMRVPRFQFLVFAAVLAASLVSFAVFVMCVQFHFPGFSGSGKGKRSEKGGRFLLCLSERFRPQVFFLPFTIAPAVPVLRFKKHLIQQAAAASVYDISSVKKRRCTVGLAMVRFLLIYWIDERVVILPWAATLLPLLPLFMRCDLLLVVFLGALVAAASAEVVFMGPAAAAALDGALCLVCFNSLFGDADKLNTGGEFSQMTLFQLSRILCLTMIGRLGTTPPVA